MRNAFSIIAPLLWVAAVVSLVAVLLRWRCESALLVLLLVIGLPVFSNLARK